MCFRWPQGIFAQWCMQGGSTQILLRHAAFAEKFLQYFGAGCLQSVAGSVLGGIGFAAGLVVQGAVGKKVEH